VSKLNAELRGGQALKRKTCGSVAFHVGSDFSGRRPKVDGHVVSLG
jgi:hypothetical protein